MSFLFPLWDPNRQVTYFTYGGSFSAEKESPRGLKDNALYGPSTNQGILNGSSRTDLHPDDYVFYRPTQSEKVMAEMGEIHLLRGEARGRLEDLLELTPQECDPSVVPRRGVIPIARG